MRARTKLAYSLSVVSMVLGFMVAVQYKQQTVTHGMSGVFSSADPEQKQMLTELTALKKSNANAQQQLAALTGQLSSFEQASVGGNAELQQLQQRLQDERILAGVTPVTGPGISVTLMDGVATGANVEQVLTHDWDIRSVINELFTAGAEAVSINGYRVVATSGIFCTGPVVKINDHRIGAPFTIYAIGDPQTLQSALTIQGGILDSLRQRGVNASEPEIMQTIDMPAFTGTLMANGTQ
ncbi:DUF881 domain-containing protein [Alicyclobacillus mengziensis]|uniref:DUF881 domain-containing protein n=1 Tax=Alicyclobacillus mengziensis TaxID=2931921 RepID=A0A9X7Z9E2_9BACL|nr:DUF881 domain-containing protein [Alicyclobacillus mengziensis]QSO49471.1 DUF881 domain-containing protein [Alicyclobacillus mengziensis]